MIVEPYMELSEMGLDSDRIDRITPSSVIARRQGYNKGIIEGRRRERLQLKCWIASQESKYAHNYTNLKNWLSGRSKRKGRSDGPR